MQYFTFTEQSEYPIALLIKNSAFARNEIEGNYVKPLFDAGVSTDLILAMSLEYDRSGKISKAGIKEYLAEIMPILKQYKTKVIYCADAEYFKALTKQTKAEPHLGYVLGCQVPGYEEMSVILGVNHKSLIYNPSNEGKLALSITSLITFVGGTYAAPGQGIIKHAEYPATNDAIKTALLGLMSKPYLSCDIEAASLRHNEAGIATITFCWSKHDGISFAVDYVPYSVPLPTGEHGYMKVNHQVRTWLKEFFQAYTGNLRFHNATYDVKVLIYELWMEGRGYDNESLLQGLEVMTRNFDDTKIITYLATNSCAGNKLGLKEQAHEYAGNWAQDDIKNVLKIPLPQLLEYNLIDGLCTNYVYEKHWPTVVHDKQEDLYQGLMKQSLQTIIQLELTGMPMDLEAVKECRAVLEAQLQRSMDDLYAHPVLHQFEAQMQIAAMEAKNKTLKKKQYALSAFAHLRFNPNSNPQTAQLLYGWLKLPIIDRTKSKEPAVGAKTLSKLINHTTDPAVQSLLEALIRFAKAAKVLSSFIPSFEASIKHSPDDDVHWLHGSFNLGGTVSGRLSSSNPNMQNIPAGSMYAKLVKKCFKAPKGWIMAGADFNSLEDYISALTTKDPNKLKVYTEKFDGHSLRAFSYWPHKFPFTEITPELSFAIKKDPILDAIRSKSKSPTFALTYQGTYITLMKDLGFSEAEAKAIEANYHELYQVSDKYVQDRLDRAAIDGYVEVAFGLRLRTPLLQQCIRDSRFRPYEADAEGRTAGNALGQSYGLLNNRAFNEFMGKVWRSKYRNDVRPLALIHDAIYLLIRDDPETVAWVNKELTASMRWQDLPELHHDTVKIGAELDLFWPTWANAIGLDPYDDVDEIIKKCQEGVSAYQEAQAKAA